MSDKKRESGAPWGSQIRHLRRAAGLTLEALAVRAGTSAPALHRYENGWDRFEIATLARIAAALGARLEVRLVPAEKPRATRKPDSRGLLKSIKPLFWDHPLKAADLERHAEWVVARVLTHGQREQVRAVRSFFGDRVLRQALGRRDVDARTRNYWQLMLSEGGAGASEGSRR